VEAPQATQNTAGIYTCGQDRLLVRALNKAQLLIGSTCWMLGEHTRKGVREPTAMFRA